MTYKAFEDFYHDAEIKHLVLHKHEDYLISPPFCTEKCKDYNSVMTYKDGKFQFIELDLPSATSKFNGICSIDDDIWTIPYGIWDSFNVIVQLKNFKPIYHYIEKKGKGQFYSLATNGNQGFSFPLGYHDTAFAIHISNDQVELIDFETNNHKKMHMGTVYCNGRFWSPPRGDTEGYQNIVSYDGSIIETYAVEFDQTHILRKYTDFIVRGHKLYALPFGQNGHLDQILVFDTETLTHELVRLELPMFFKKYNCGVLIGDTIIALPYGDKSQQCSNYGLVYNCETGKHKSFNIGDTLGFGGKYRFRCGFEYNGNAVFFPSGTPAIPLMVIDIQGNVIHQHYFSEYVLGRPTWYQDKLWTIAYHLETKQQFLFCISSDFTVEFIQIP
jgi:hypothetical protein